MVSSYSDKLEVHIGSDGVAYITFSETIASTTKELNADVLADYDTYGNLIGIELLSLQQEDVLDAVKEALSHSWVPEWDQEKLVEFIEHDGLQTVSEDIICL